MHQLIISSGGEIKKKYDKLYGFYFYQYRKW